MGEHQLFLSLGGNLGNKSEIFYNTIQNIEERIGRKSKISSIYQSPSWGFRSRYIFWNQIIEVKTCLSPQEILNEIRIIENQFGRLRKPGVYNNRKMDIDILFYDDLILDTEELTIPHRYIALRKFILEPLYEIAPDLLHPVLKEKIHQIRLTCVDSVKVTRIES